MSKLTHGVGITYKFKTQKSIFPINVHFSTKDIMNKLIINGWLKNNNITKVRNAINEGRKTKLISRISRGVYIFNR